MGRAAAANLGLAPHTYPGWEFVPRRWASAVVRGGGGLSCRLRLGGVANSMVLRLTVPGEVGRIQTQRGG